jgi:hypothetical protein
VLRRPPARSTGCRRLSPWREASAVADRSAGGRHLAVAQERLELKLLIACGVPCARAARAHAARLGAEYRALASRALIMNASGPTSDRFRIG